MAKYRIKHWGKQKVEIYGGNQYWQEIQANHAADLDLAEIAELNKLPANTKPRKPSVLYRAIMSVLALLFIVALLSWDAIPFLHMPDLGFLSRSAQLHKDEALASLQKAVVSIEGANATGSGFNLRSEGLIVSNRHVVENNMGLTVIFADGSRYLAKEWQYIEGYDLAIASIKGENLPCVELGAVLPEEGEEMIFIGNPLGFDWTISEAVMLQTITVEEQTVLYFSGPVRSGNSGSPLFNSQGQVIGVVFASLRNAADVGLAIPAQLLLEYARQE